MPSLQSELTPQSLLLLQAVAQHGSLAGAARAMGVVPSALTYRVRQLEDALDVLLLDRSARQARLTPAGAELLTEGTRLLAELDAVAQRVKRVATGWEPTFTVAVDGTIAKATVLELCERFLQPAPPTRIRLRDEVLSGTLEALTSGGADLALGVAEQMHNAPIHTLPLGEVKFVFAVAPHHPLAQASEPLSDDTVRAHRVVAVADSTQRSPGLTVGLLGGQDVLTVATMDDKIQAQLRGLGCGSVPESMVRGYLQTGRLVARRLQQPARQVRVMAAWRQGKSVAQGLALRWWLDALASPVTRAALLDRHTWVPGV